LRRRANESAGGVIKLVSATKFAATVSLIRDVHGIWIDHHNQTISVLVCRPNDEGARHDSNVRLTPFSRLLFTYACITSQNWPCDELSAKASCELCARASYGNIEEIATNARIPSTFCIGSISVFSNASKNELIAQAKVPIAQEKRATSVALAFLPVAAADLNDVSNSAQSSAPSKEVITTYTGLRWQRGSIGTLLSCWLMTEKCEGKRTHWAAASIKLASRASPASSSSSVDCRLNIARTAEGGSGRKRSVNKTTK
jgi:hypothetical protein